MKLRIQRSFYRPTNESKYEQAKFLNQLLATTRETLGNDPYDHSDTKPFSSESFLLRNRLGFKAPVT